MKKALYILSAIIMTIYAASCNDGKKNYKPTDQAENDTIALPQNSPEEILSFTCQQIFNGHIENALGYLFEDEFFTIISSRPDTINSLNKQTLATGNKLGGFKKLHIRKTSGKNDTLYVFSNIEFNNTTLYNVPSKLIRRKGNWSVVLLKDYAPLTIDVNHLKVKTR